ncbi:hypothetical protein IFR05_004348 [Cadophora sp. M221]|nr:hypothetical protein IFR05_004348 [Cadophora sp. M221]
MERHVSSPESQEAPATDAGVHPHHQSHTQEYYFSRRGEASIPRYLGPVHVSRTSNLISNSLQDHQVPRSFYRPSHDEDCDGDYGGNYSFGRTASREIDVELAQAVRAFTLEDTEDGITTSYGHYSLEGSTSRHVHKGKNSAESHARESGISAAAITKGRSFENKNNSNVPRTSVGLHTHESKNASLDDNAGTLGTPKESHDAQHQDRGGTRMDPIEGEPGESKRMSVDEGTLADLAYRKTYFLGLGTWPSPDVEASADAPSSSVASPSPSDVNSTFSASSLSDNSKQGFTQCGQGGTGSTGSRPQARQSSEGSNTFGNSQGQGSGSRNGKRPTGSGDGQDDGGGGSGNKKFKDDETPLKTPSHRFACPFQKHDPADVSYDGTKGRYRSCTGVGFPTIARLKEHLYRCHLIPITCGRCQATFPEQEKLDDHHLEAIRCEYRPKTSLGITPAVQKELRRKMVVQDPEEKWWEIYRLIFPLDSLDSLDSLPSSPYCRHDGGRDSNDFAEHNMPHNIHDGSGDFNEYAERNMAEALDVSLSPILDDWDGSPDKRAYLKDAIIKCHRELWERFWTSKEATTVAPSDEMENAGQHEALPEPYFDFPFQHNPLWSLDGFMPQQDAQFAAIEFSGPFLSGPFPPMQQLPPAAREVPTLIYDRPRPPQRGNSFRSDSAFGTSSVCDQCSNGKLHRCFTPMTPTTGMASESIQAERSSTAYPATIGSVMHHKDHTYSSQLDPSMFLSSWPKENGAPGLPILNYCGQYPDLQNAQR